MSAFSALHWFIFSLFALVFGVLFMRLLRRVALGAPKGHAMVCTTCGHHGPTRQHTRGSIFIELVLWLLFIVPGLIYSLGVLLSGTQAHPRGFAHRLGSPRHSNSASAGFSQTH